MERYKVHYDAALLADEASLSCTGQKVRSAIRCIKTLGVFFALPWGFTDQKARSTIRCIKT